MNEKLIEEINNDNVLQFKKPLLKLAPKDPTDDGDWLSGMKVGTEFKAHDKLRDPSWLVRDLTYLGKLKGDVYLCPTNALQDSKQWFWVNPVAFCREWEFRGIIEEPQDQDEDITE